MRNLEATHRSASGGPGGRSVAAPAPRAVAALTASLVLAAASWLSVAPARAQGNELDGTGVRVGQTRLFPELRLDYIAYDNVFLDSEDPTEATAAQLSPSVRWEAGRRLAEIEASYVGRYSTGSEDILDFAEHTLGLNGAAAPSSRSRVEGYASYRLFGEDLRVVAPGEDEPSRVRVDIDRYDLGGWYGYGAAGARGNVRLGIDIDGYDPDVDDEEAIVLRRRQFTRVQPYARFSLRVSPDTRLLLETRFSDISRDGGRAGDSRVSVLTGLGFATSGAFGGEFRVGATRISFDSDIDDENTLRVAASLFFQPTSFSRFDLLLSRDFDPRFGSSGVSASTAITTSAALDWRYAYSDRVSHRARLAVEDEDVDCPLAGERQVDVGFELNLRVRRWIELGAGVDHEIDRLDDCGEEGIDIDADLLETDATRLGAHVRLIL